MGSPAMARILLLSNGHGEDLSGSLLAKELQQQGAGEVFAVTIAQQQDACHRRGAHHYIQVLGSGMPLAHLVSCNRRASLARRSCRI